MNWIMLVFGVGMIAYAVVKDAKPMLLIPLGFGVLVGNIPVGGLGIGVFEEGSILNALYLGVERGILPPVLFLGLGAMTDFSPMLANPRMALLGIAAPLGILVTVSLSMLFGFSTSEAFAIGVAGGGDPAAAVYLSTRLGGTSAALFPVVCLAAVLINALTPVLLPPTLRLVTTEKERGVPMGISRMVSATERRMFPVVGFLICALISPGAVVLTGMLFFGNLLKESGVAERLAGTARGALMDTAMIFFGFAVGVASRGTEMLTLEAGLVFLASLIGYPVGAVGGVFLAKGMNVFGKTALNPLLGAAGVAALPDATRAVDLAYRKEHPSLGLMGQAAGANAAGLIASALTAGIFWSVMVGG